MLVWRFIVATFVWLLLNSILFADYPNKLLQWPIFKTENNEYLELAENSVPYDLTNPLFSDYAIKFRTIYIPPNTTIKYKSTGILDFPVGTIISKTFAYKKSSLIFNDGFADPLRSGIGYKMTEATETLANLYLIETRLLIKEANGWVGLPYLWQADQKDASLQLTGKKLAVSVNHEGISHTFTYKVPNFNQCRSCHLQMDGFDKHVLPIGPQARHLNRTYSYPEGEDNQLLYFEKFGILENLPPLEKVAREYSIYDESAPIAQRARAYLDINCAHCHNPKGPASSSGLFLHFDNNEPSSLGICKSPIAVGNGGNQYKFDIVPGAPDESILVHRLVSNDPSIMMPEVGRSLSHKEGIDVIVKWIMQMGGNCEN